MKIAISTETTVDLTKDLIDKYNVKIVPFTVNLGDDSFLDGEITSEEIISYVDKTGILPKTSAVNEFQYEEHFGNLLNDFDAIIHISISSELSCAYNNAVKVASKLKNVYVIDSRSLSTGIALLVLYAAKLINQGFEPEVIYKKVLDRVNNVQASFALNRLDYLYKGGRCSSLMYFGANILKIRPQILLKDGKMVSGNKYRGNMSIICKKYLADVLNEFSNPDLEEVFITYTTCDANIVESIKESLYNYGFKNVNITRAGGTITSHCGEECLGVLYINDGGAN
jgi:DegV family protein with EDD domain